MKIGIYGGTFNPIHTGHMEAAKFAAEHMQLDVLYLIPAGLPPHKTLAEDTPNAEHRLNMAKLAAGSIGKYAKVLDIELRRTGKSYTVDTLREIRAMHPEDTLYFFMGTDMFLTFQKWYKPGEIAKLCTLCAFSRSEKDTEELFAAQRKYLAKELNAHVVTVALPKVVEISSTQLREALRLGRGRDFLCDAVYGYILREKLYGTGRDMKALPLEDLRCVALSMLSPGRTAHVLGTEETAARLAARWGVSEECARRAALLHDCTKALSREQHLTLLRQYSIEADPVELKEDALLHARSGAAVAKHIFGESSDIVSAIRFHTTGKADMTELEKIIYLSDYIEPTRDFCDLSRVRELSTVDLDRAVLTALTMSIENLERKNGAIHPNSVCARDHLKGKLS